MYMLHYNMLQRTRENLFKYAWNDEMFTDNKPGQNQTVRYRRESRVLEK